MRWSLWELVAYVDGRNELNAGDGDKAEAMSDDAFEALLARHNIKVK